MENEVAYAKLTRWLRICGRRDDGMHFIESEMVTIDLSDKLSFLKGNELIVEGPYSKCPELKDSSANLVTKALNFLGLKAKVILDKHIPVRAGLGGGSADAAAVFRWAHVLYEEKAAQLGSDIPFCLRGGRSLVSGIGEHVENLEFKQLTFVLFILPIKTSTKDVYDCYDEMEPGHHEINDLTYAALKVSPELGKWFNYLKVNIGTEPTLAGSGSTLFYEGSINKLGCPTSEIVFNGRRAKIVEVSAIKALY